MSCVGCERDWPRRASVPGQHIRPDGGLLDCEIRGDLAEFAAFYQLAAYYRRRLLAIEVPLTSAERQALHAMLADYEVLMTKTREMMLRFQALGP